MVGDFGSEFGKATGTERMAVDIVAVLRRETHGEREVHLAFVDAGDLLAADRRLHHGVHVADGDAVARRLGAIDLDHQIRLAEQIECAGIA